MSNFHKNSLETDINTVLRIKSINILLKEVVNKCIRLMLHYILFAEITHRFQTARREVRQLLLQYLLPWLHNMELVDPNVPPPSNPLSYYQVKFIDYLLNNLPIIYH